MVIFNTSQSGTGLGVNFTMTISIPANGLVIVTGHTSNNTSLVPSSANLTFAQVGSNLSYSANGEQQIYRAFSANALASEVITMTQDGSGPQCTGVVATFTGVNTIGSNGSGAIGATTTFTSGGATANTANITTTGKNSLVIGLFGQTSNATMTAGTGQTAITATAQSFSRSSIARHNAVSPIQEIVTSNETMGASVACGCMVIEILSSDVSNAFRPNNLRPHAFSPGLAR